MEEDSDEETVVVVRRKTTKEKTVKRPTIHLASVKDKSDTTHFEVPTDGALYHEKYTANNHEEQYFSVDLDTLDDEKDKDFHMQSIIENARKTRAQKRRLDADEMSFQTIRTDSVQQKPTANAQWPRSIIEIQNDKNMSNLSATHHDDHEDLTNLDELSIRKEKLITDDLDNDQELLSFELQQIKKATSSNMSEQIKLTTRTLSAKKIDSQKHPALKPISLDLGLSSLNTRLSLIEQKMNIVDDSIQQLNSHKNLCDQSMSSMEESRNQIILTSVQHLLTIFLQHQSLVSFLTKNYLWMFYNMIPYLVNGVDSFDLSQNLKKSFENLFQAIDECPLSDLINPEALVHVWECPFLVALTSWNMSKKLEDHVSSIVSEMVPSPPLSFDFYLNMEKFIFPALPNYFKHFENTNHQIGSESLSDDECPKVREALNLYLGIKNSEFNRQHAIKFLDNLELDG